MEAKFATETFHVHPSHLDQVLELLTELDTPSDDGIAISVPRAKIRTSAPHATERDVLSQVELGGPINDSAALAIASWYQSPRGTGQTFAMLAQGSWVHTDELLDAIHDELSQSIVANRPELEALARWAEGVDDTES